MQELIKAFDIDGTFLDFDSKPGDEPLINQALLATLQPGERVALVTNQGGLPFGLMGAKGYPTPVTFVWRLTALANALTERGSVIASVHISTYHPKAPPERCEEAAAFILRLLDGGAVPLFVHHNEGSRKPNPAMLVEAHASVYYGDSDEDAAAAENAVVPFVRVERFTSGGGGQPLNLIHCHECGRDDKVIVADDRRWCPVCGRIEVIYLSPCDGDEYPPYNSQLWVEHEVRQSQGIYGNDRVANWAEVVYPDLDPYKSLSVWVKHGHDERPRRYEVHAEPVITFFAYEVEP